MRKLHIGGVVRAEGWENFNAVSSAAVDHLGNARDLGRFDDRSFDLVYASHVLEHFDWRHEMAPVLKEWRRVLKPGGELHVSVPDLAILCRLFLDRERLALHQRYLVVQMMYGGQVDSFDYHKAGFDEDILGACFEDAGFDSWQRVDTFDHFRDTSLEEMLGERISLNMVARNVSVDRTRDVRDDTIGRNDPCPCGSGQRYKHCHGAAR